MATALALALTLAIAASLAACSAPANLPELAAAESSERRGDDARALDHYRKAQTTCQRLDPPRRRRELCAMALLGEAEVLERRREEERQKARAEREARKAARAKGEGGEPPAASS